MNRSKSLKRTFCNIEPQDFISKFAINLNTFKKLAIFMLSITFLQVNANGQSANITLLRKNATFVQVLSEIRKQSGYGMLYNSDLMKKASTVSIDVKNVSLEEALKISLNGQPFGYTIKNNTVVITPKEENTKIAPIDVKGKVLDENKLPLIGASVRVKGGAQGI